jgi:hypothetical protein
MAQLTLDADEGPALAHALRSYLSDLRAEIGATDSVEMREQLRREEQVLAGILQRIGEPAA